MTRAEGRISSIGVIGLGLMGGSLGLAARERAGVGRVYGYSRRPETLELGLARGAITHACDSLEEAAREAEIVFVATPVRLVPGHVRSAMAAAPHAIVSDVGSTKGSLMRSLNTAQQRRCIGGHPLCGSETAGVENARPSLYEGATYFLTPGAHVDAHAYRRLHAFVAGIGARPVAVDPDEHDRVMALMSHLPHVIANVLMAQAGAQGGARDALLCAGPSFRDLTRVAGSNRRIWTDIFLENREALLAALATYRDGLDAVRAALTDGDDARLGDQIAAAAASRERLLACGSLAAEELYRVVVHVPDRTGVFREITVALGDADINIEDLALHHMSAELGGTLTVYVLGEDVCRRAAATLEALGYDVITARDVA
jgi:prephenate dehydrogenase